MALNSFFLRFRYSEIESVYFQKRSKNLSEILIASIFVLLISEISLILFNKFYFQMLPASAIITIYVCSIVLLILLIILKKYPLSSSFVSFFINLMITLALFMNIGYVRRRNNINLELNTVFLLAFSFSSFQTIYFQNPIWVITLVNMIINLCFYANVFHENGVRLSIITYIANALMTVYSFYKNEKTNRQLFYDEYMESRMNEHFKFLLDEKSMGINIVFSIKKNNNAENNLSINLNQINKLGKEKYGLNSLDDILSFLDEVEIEKDNNFKQLYTNLNFLDFDSANKVRSLKNLYLFLTSNNLINIFDLTKKSFFISINSHKKSHPSHKFSASFSFYNWKKENYVYLNIVDFVLEEKIQELTELNKMKDDLLASVTHDLRNPLSGMLHLIKEAKDENLGHNQLVESMEFAEIQGNLLMSLINDILDYSIFKNDRWKVNIESFNLKKILEEVLILFRHKAKLHNISLIVDAPSEDHIEVHSDPIRLKQVLINLISNALKFTLNGYVKITVKMEFPFINFVVDDSGVGIPPNILDKLFKPFATYSNSLGMNKNGIGLGLIISKKIVEKLGPESKNLEVSSIVDKGSSFSFKIFGNLERALKKSYSSNSIILEFDDTDNKSLHSRISTKNLIYNESSIKSMDVFRPNKPSKECKQSFFPNEENIVVEIRQSLLETIETKKIKKINFLIADDDELIILIIQNYIKKLGLQNIINIEAAQNGKIALDKYKLKNQSDDPFDIILLDWEMPIMNGIDVAEKIERLVSNENYKRAYLVGLSGHSEKMGMKDVQDIVMKPCSLERFGKLLLKILSKIF